MCNPAAVALVAVAATAVSTGMQISGQQAAAKAQKAEADANELMAQSAAVSEFADSRFDLFKHGLDMRRTIGTQEALAAAANLDLTFGTAKGILSDRYRFSAMESTNIGINAARRSIALKNSAAAYGAMGANIKRGATYASIGTGIAGVGQAIGAGYSGYQLGSSFKRTT